MSAPDAAPQAIIDTHVHYWHLSRNPWYPALQSEDALGIGDMAPLVRDYLPEQHRQDAASFTLAGAVHITAVTAPGSHQAEAEWLDTVRAETGLPTAMIGGVEVADADAVPGAIERQAASPIFRGIRMMEGLDPEVPGVQRLVQTLAAGGHILDAVIRTEEIDAVLPMLSRHDNLEVVLEHTGWPSGVTDEDRTAWRAGLARLAQLPQVICKISGLSMVLHTVQAEPMRPWIETAIEVFGPARCVWGSNFPVDSLYGEYDVLTNSYLAGASGCTPEERDAIFVQNAKRVYRL